MSRQGSGGGGSKPRGGGRSGKPRGQSGQTGRSPTSTGLAVGIFAKMRQNLDVVAFGVPGGPTVDVRVYQESVETFQQRKGQPRSFVVILSQSLDTTEFEAFQAPYRSIEPLLQKAQLVSGERAYWKLKFSRAGRKLLASDDTRTELQKVEKR